MKAQKLGLVLGMNMAVACMMMQGCKANKAQSDLPPDTTTVVATAPADATAATTAPADVAPGVAVDTTAPAVGNSVAGTAPTASSGVVIEKPTHVEPPPPPPSRVPTVGKLPPVGSKPVATTKPVATGSSAGTAPTASAPTETGFVYTVKPGDQLFAVSRKYNVRMDAIKRANPGLNPDKIKIGQKITIPGVAGPATAVAGTSAAGTAPTMQASATVPTAGAANTTAPVKTKPAFKAYTGPTKEYVVKSGDSLGKLAYDNGITIRALQELNGIPKDKVGLRIGQKLLIPAEKVVAETKAAAPAAKTSDVPKIALSKTVEPAAGVKGESAEAKPAAAPEVKAPEAKVDEPGKKAEPAKVDDAKANEPEPKVETPAVETPAPAPAAGGNTYTVKEGDDLVSVSITWGISPSQLMDLNGLKAGDAIKPGQVLKLPANAKAVQ